jgi:membrane-associated phospholipid phosphatase
MANLHDLSRTVLPARPVYVRPVRRTLRRSGVARPRSLVPSGSARAQFVAVGLAFLAYSVVRFFTQGDRANALHHGRDLLRLEGALGIDWERGVQDLVIGNDAIRQFFTLLYAWGYWPVVAGTLVVLWRWDRALFGVFRNALFLSGAVGLVVFAVYPAAPPRMLDGFTDTVAASGQHFVAHPSGFTNPYAALPSFHAGWFFLAAVVLARATRRARPRLAMHLLAPLMSVAVVVTANHYIVDVVLGIGLSLGALAVAGRVADRRSRCGSGDDVAELLPRRSDGEDLALAVAA